MDLHAYLSKHDGKPSPRGAECIRLTERAGLRSPYRTYLVALGHKQFSPQAARRLAEASLEGELTAAELRPDVFGPVAA